MCLILLHYSNHGCIHNHDCNFPVHGFVQLLLHKTLSHEASNYCIAPQLHLLYVYLLIYYV